MSEEKKKKSNRGFASFTREKLHEVASRGGKAVSFDKEHMAQIGSLGGLKGKGKKKNK